MRLGVSRRAALHGLGTERNPLRADEEGWAVPGTRRRTRRQRRRRAAGGCGHGREQAAGEGQERRQREKTNGSKRSSEPDKLDTSEHNREIKRMRAYSHDETKTTTSNTATSSTNGTNHSHNDQRPRTRSIDVKEEQNLQISNTITSLTVEEWKLQHSITIQQHHGRGASSSSSNSQNVPIPTPYRTFEETPFSPKIVSLFHQAKFIAPTPIQAQAWPIAVQQYDMICIAKTGSGSYVYQNGCWMMICVLYVVFPSSCSVTTYTCIMFYSLSNHFF